MFKILLTSLMLFAPVVTFHDVTPIRVIDGDTYEADVRVAPLGITFRARMRLLGVDCAEMSGVTKEEGLRLKGVLDQTLGLKPHRLELHGKDNFGRWLVKTYVGDVDVVAHMISKGCAVR